METIWALGDSTTPRGVYDNGDDRSTTDSKLRRANMAQHNGIDFCESLVDVPAVRLSLPQLKSDLI